MKKWLPCQRCLKLPGQGSPPMEVADRILDLESLAASNYRKYGHPPPLNTDNRRTNNERSKICRINYTPRRTQETTEYFRRIQLLLLWFS
jgi:hypothetical protein